MQTKKQTVKVATPRCKNLEKGLWQMTVLMLIKYRLINYRLAPILWQWLVPVSVLTVPWGVDHKPLFHSHLVLTGACKTLRVGRGQSHLSLFPTKRLFFSPSVQNLSLLGKSVLQQSVWMYKSAHNHSWSGLQWRQVVLGSFTLAPIIFFYESTRENTTSRFKVNRICRA